MVMKRPSSAASHPAHIIRLVIEIEANLASSKAPFESYDGGAVRCDLGGYEVDESDFVENTKLWRSEHTILQCAYLWEA